MPNISDSVEIIHRYLTADAALKALLAVYRYGPAIYTDPVAPPDMDGKNKVPYPCIHINGAKATWDDNLAKREYRTAMSVDIYTGQHTSRSEIDAITERARLLLHRHVGGNITPNTRLLTIFVMEVSDVFVDPFGEYLQQALGIEVWSEQLP